MLESPNSRMQSAPTLFPSPASYLSELGGWLFAAWKVFDWLNSPPSPSRRATLIHNHLSVREKDRLLYWLGINRFSQWFRLGDEIVFFDWRERWLCDITSYYSDRPPRLKRGDLLLENNEQFDFVYVVKECDWDADGKAHVIVARDLGYLPDLPSYLLQQGLWV